MPLNSRCFARETRYFFSMSTQEILLQEIKQQPEPVLRELRQYLDFLKHQRETEVPMDHTVADTWEKIGPAPDVDYDQL